MARPCISWRPTRSRPSPARRESRSRSWGHSSNTESRRRRLTHLTKLLRLRRFQIRALQKGLSSKKTKREWWSWHQRATTRMPKWTTNEIWMMLSYVNQLRSLITDEKTINKKIKKFKKEIKMNISEKWNKVKLRIFDLFYHILKEQKIGKKSIPLTIFSRKDWRVCVYHNIFYASFCFMYTSTRSTNFMILIKYF